MAVRYRNRKRGGQTPEGPADPYLPNRQIMVEVKKAGRLRNGPKRAGTGSRRGESAYGQLEWYVLAEMNGLVRYRCVIGA